MDAKPPPPRASLGDLGLRVSRLTAAVVAGATLPAAIPWLMGASPGTVAGVAATALLTSCTLLGSGLRYLRRTMVAPLQAMTQAMDDLRTQGKAPWLADAWVPLLQPMVRLFNQACQSIEQREQLSQANLISVEVAFDRVHAVLQALREGVVVVNTGGRVALANRSARQVVRSECGPIEGCLLVDLVGGELGQAIQQGMERSNRSAAEVHSTDIAHGDHMFDLTIVQMQSSRPDHDFGKVVVLVDVTKHHEINRLKDDLLSSISHELRTPLTNICSSSEILVSIDPKQEVEWREFVRILATESHRLKLLVDDVMLYSQIETGGTVWRRETTDLHALVTSAIEGSRPAAARGELELQVEADRVPTVEIDRERIGEVVARLLDNAIKFTPARGRILVRVHGHAAGIEVSVADSGPGIPAGDRQRVFEGFSQVGDLMTSKPKGAGLGLAICRRIVEAMGGTMCCEDSPLGGVQFRFVLPATAPAPALA
ncbi:MAG: HAMP domain-containing sensor histidine kinase [Planctomycetota bacterium]